MPINRCPVCDQEFPCDKANNRNEGGLFILPIEPFSTDSGGASGGGGGGGSGGGAAGETEDGGGGGGDDRGGRDGDQQQQQQQNQQHSRWVRWAPCVSCLMTSCRCWFVFGCASLAL